MRSPGRKPAFAAGETTTKFLERNLHGWPPPPQLSELDWLALAAFESLLGGAAGESDDSLAAAAGRWRDPWSHTEAWRNVR